MYEERGVPPALRERWWLLLLFLLFPGDGEPRKVRSVIDPELACLLSPEAGRSTEVLRRTVRFVWTSATLIGVVGRARRAAAAAAALRDPEEDSRRWPVKADRAADAADGLAVEALRGCWAGG